MNGLNAHVSKVADAAGICVWLMRGCGLRIEEALAVEKSGFREDGKILRVSWQATRDSAKTAPLKKRKPGEYRDVPVPTWLWEMVMDLPDGPLMPGNGERRFQPVRNGLRPVHDSIWGSGDTGGLYATLTASRVRVRGAGQGRSDYRRGALAGTP